MNNRWGDKPCDTVGDDDGEFEGTACGADVDVVAPPVPP